MPQMQNSIWMIVALGMAVLAILLVIILVSGQNKRARRDRERLMQLLHRENESQHQDVERLNRAVNDSLQQVAELSGAMDARMDAFSRQNSERLNEMRDLVGEKLEGRLNASFRMVNAQLADVHRGVGEMKELAANVTDIKKVLGNVKTRGVWGEMLLGNLLSELFAPDQYICNAAIPAGSQQRVEFALKLPCADGESMLLPIESKFPQEDYVRLVEAQEEAQRERQVRLLERNLMEQAKTISEKYICPPQTVDFAIMFLPVEGLYAEAARIPGLIERLQSKHRVLIAGPSTLCALLTSLQVSFRTSALEKRSGEVLDLFTEFQAEFLRFQEGMARVRSRINQAETELDALEARARKLSKLIGRAGGAH